MLHTLEIHAWLSWMAMVAPVTCFKSIELVRILVFNDALNAVSCATANDRIGWMIACRVYNGMVWYQYAFESGELTHHYAQNAIHNLSMCIHKVFRLQRTTKKKEGKCVFVILELWKNTVTKIHIESHLCVFVCALWDANFSCKFYCNQPRHIDGFCDSFWCHLKPCRSV